MNKLFRNGLLLSLLFVCASCHWLKDDDKIPVYYEAMVTVESLDKPSFRTDAGHLFLSETSISLNDSVDVNDRLWLYFSITDSVSETESRIQIYSYAIVDIKEMFCVENQKSDTLISSNPLRQLNRCWISNDYLNIIFNQYSSIGESRFELIRNLQKEDSNKDYISLELRHDADRIDWNWYGTQMISYSLLPLKEKYASQDTITIQFLYLTDQKRSHTFHYVPKR